MEDTIKLSYTTTENGIESESYYWAITLNCCICELGFLKHSHWIVLYPYIKEPGFVCCDVCEEKLRDCASTDINVSKIPDVVRWCRKSFLVDGVPEELTFRLPNES